MLKAIARPIVTWLLESKYPNKSQEDLEAHVEEVLDAIPIGTAAGAIIAVVIAIIATGDDRS